MIRFLSPLTFCTASPLGDGSIKKGSQPISSHHFHTAKSGIFPPFPVRIVIHKIKIVITKSDFFNEFTQP